MKTRVIVIIGVVLVVCSLWAEIPFLVVGGGDPAVPTPITTNGLRAKTLVFIGHRSARVPNAGAVWIQNSPTNDSPGIKLLSGQTISLTAGANGFDLRDFYVDPETTNDSVVVLIFQ